MAICEGSLMHYSGSDRCVAIIATLLVHWLLFKLLITDGPVMEARIASSPFRIRLVEREPSTPWGTHHSAPAVIATFRPSPVPQSSAALRASVEVSASESTAPALHKDKPLDLTFINPHAPDFSRRPLEGDTRLHRFAVPPERIPMRKPLTCKDVIEGAAQILGFWPPGYTIDPCPRIRRNIDELKTDGSAAGRERLEQEMARQARYCP